MGTAAVVGNQVRFTPDPNWQGTETFKYVMQDVENNESQASITVTVTSVNDDPVANDDISSTYINTAIVIDVLANDTDLDGTSMTIQNGGFIDPVNGTVSIVNGKVEYTPDLDWEGYDTFTYTVEDEDGGTDTAEVTVWVRPDSLLPLSTTFITPTEGEKYKKGDTVSVSWQSVGGDPGDVITYKLEFYNGNSWVELADNLETASYQHLITDETIHTDQAKYRVYTYNGFKYSDDVTSPEIIIDTTPPADVIYQVKTADSVDYVSGKYVNQSVYLTMYGGTDLLDISYTIDDGYAQAPINEK